MTPVVETNCHPFQFGQFLFQHNGVLASFFEIHVDLLKLLAPTARAAILGTTDSEIIAALFFTHLDPFVTVKHKTHTLEEMKVAMRSTLKDLQRLIDLVPGSENTHSELNLAVTDGRRLLAIRFAHPPTQEPPSLYYSTIAGATLSRLYDDHPDAPLLGGAVAESGKKPREQVAKHCIVASEPSTYRGSDWHLMKPGEMITVDEDLSHSLEMI